MPPSPEGVLQIDFAYDLRQGLVMAGAGGVRLYRQEAARRFVDVTAATRLAVQVLDRSYVGARAAAIVTD